MEYANNAIEVWTSETNGLCDARSVEKNYKLY